MKEPIFPNIKVFEAYNLYKTEKIGTRKIAELFKVSRPTVKRRFKELGLELVNNSTRKIFFNESHFENIDSIEKAYWLGFLYADGSISRNKNKPYPYNFELSLKPSDIDHVMKLAKVLDIDTKKIKISNYRCRLLITSKKLCADLIDKGCTERKSLTLKFPDENFLRKEFQIDFIRGYFDGDGHINNPLKHQIGINCLGTEAFLFKMLKVLEINKPIVKSKPNTNCYQFSLTGNNSLYFMNTIYRNSQIHLDRKYYRYILYFALCSRNITKVQGKIGEVLQKEILDNTERVALEYLLKM